MPGNESEAADLLDVYLERSSSVVRVTPVAEGCAAEYATVRAGLSAHRIGCIVALREGLGKAGHDPGDPLQQEEGEMALSDQLAKLSQRAKEAEEHAAAARDKTKADVENDRKMARATAQAQADRLHESADANRARISAWWHDVQRSWSQHVAAVKEDLTDRRAEHDLDRANKRAENAEGDAAFAIDYAVAAIDEAEYAVLDASLARMEANELAGASA